MKRTLILLIVFLLLGGGAFWYLSTDDERNKMTLAGSDRDFAVEDMSKLHKIFIAGRKGERTTLLRNDEGGWDVEGGGKTNPNVMNPLLEAIHNVRIKYKPSDNALKNMVNVLATQSKKVELYDKEGNLLKAYYIGGSTADERGTYIIMDGAEQPYVAEMPGFSGNLSVRFDRLGDEWRDKNLFSKKVEDIKYLSVEYPKQKNQSFILEASGSDFTVKPFYDITPEIQRPFKEGSVEACLTNFESVGAEAFRNQHSGRDSILQTIPFCSITLVNKSEDTTRAVFYPIIKETITTQDRKTGDYVTTGGYLDRYFVLRNQKDFMLAQQIVVQKVFWGYGSFYQDTNLLN
ncbi:MAG: DUF4340 domain-containing protein [Phaeodactylibacter sp.]|uniref:DUF4340 domain-containing protein n=1 Tax=Phaeodactylibacter sp. TaxID=1940289 RepID=UPI0032EACFEB